MNVEEKKEFNVQFWRFLWASILIGLSACLGNVVDAMIVGNLLDEDSVSAINLSLPLLQFMYSIVWASSGRPLLPTTSIVSSTPSSASTTSRYKLHMQKR